MKQNLEVRQALYSFVLLTIKNTKSY